jgi:hypothetical protein
MEAVEKPLSSRLRRLGDSGSALRRRPESAAAQAKLHGGVAGNSARTCSLR